jgi:hypothetical protein
MLRRQNETCLQHAYWKTLTLATRVLASSLFSFSICSEFTMFGVDLLLSFEELLMLHEVNCICCAWARLDGYNFQWQSTPSFTCKNNTLFYEWLISIACTQNRVLLSVLKTEELQKKRKDALFRIIASFMATLELNIDISIKK